MDIVAENFRYIELGVAKGAYNDEKHMVHIEPERSIEKDLLFGQITASFWAFSTYLTTFSHPVPGDFQQVLAYLQAQVRNSTLEDQIRGYNTLRKYLATGRRADAEKRACLQKNAEEKSGLLREAEIDKLFLSCSAYIGNLGATQFYKADYIVAKYYHSRKMAKLAGRFARESLKIAGKLSTEKGVEDAKELLRMVERRGW